MITPIFLFSLPRSGSTLLQRILVGNKIISSVSEPWLLLPYFYTLKKSGIYSEYANRHLVTAIQDLCDEMPEGIKDYRSEIRKFTLNVYQKIAGEDKTYFLDKTPRYYLIIDEIIETFPNAKFVFLWRNPLSIVSSIIDTWGNGKWMLYRSKIDIYKGIDNMVNAFKKYEEKVYSVNYEKLVTKDHEELKGLFDYLDITFNQDALEKFDNVNLKGQLGDKNGIKNYKSIENTPIDKWKNQMSHYIRKIWCRKYLRWIGKDRLEIMGYSYETLNQELNETKTKYTRIISDLLRIMFGYIYCFGEPFIIRDKLIKIIKKERIYPHS